MKEEPAETHRIERWTGSKVREADYHMARRVLLEELAPEPCDRILEIGPGPGTWTAEVARRAGHVVAVDILDTRMEQARANTAGLPVELIHGDILHVPLEGPFTKVFSSRAIEYIFDLDRLAERIAGLLAPGGTLVFITKTRFSIWRGRARVRRALLRPPGTGGKKDPSQRLLSPGQLVRAFAPYSITPVRVRPVVMRPPLFREGFNEFPVIPESVADPVLGASTRLFRLASRPPLKLAALPLLLTECYCITFSRAPS